MGVAAVKLTLHQFDLPLRHMFTIARGSTTVSRTLIVELEHDGISGFGEAGENDFYGATIDGMRAMANMIPKTRMSWPMSSSSQ